MNAAPKPRAPTARTAATLAGLGLLLGAAALLAGGPLPGDLALTRALQSLADPSAEPARLLSEAGRMPILAGAAGLCALAAAWLAGWRAGLALVAALALAKLIELGLRATLHVPRPTAELVEVVAPSASSGLPSTFGLVFGATVGCLLLAASASRRKGAGAVVAVALAVLVAGVVARVLPGGHWPSQVLASILLSMGLSAALLRIVLPR